MRRTLALLVLGLAGISLQGALPAWVPAALVPDASLLATVAAALLLGPAEGLVLAFAFGLTADLLSGALLGQHALLRTLELPFIRVVSAQLDLRRGLPLATFVLGLGALDALGMLGLGRVFVGPLPLGVAALGPVLAAIVATAVVAPLAVGIARAVVTKLDESAVRREMRLDTRRPAI